jgi:uncharacterized protein YecE (DUF72 family)
MEGEHKDEAFLDEENYVREHFPARGDERETEHLFIGTSGWSYKDWVGSFFAPGTRPEGYLASYAGCFKTVEIDSSFYAVPRESVIRAWNERSPAGFRFAAKFPRDITHEPGGLEPNGRLCRLFLDRMALLEDRLGPLLLQFPPTFHADAADTLWPFLESLSADFRIAVEFRHDSWHGEETLAKLAGLNMAWASGIGPLNPPVRPLTTDFAYIRWLGDRSIGAFNETILDRDAEIAGWARWIEEQRKKLREIYGYFNNHYAGHGPASAARLLELLGEVKPVPPARRQGDLFD